ncbi:DUF1189 domain-containing protein [Candidatus Woesearchaeota archaeon]|nr:DUF1189 domain-containing protein [Candidatus Woesearchaeota archaeon]
MKLKRFLRHIAISVNPTKYRQVVEKTLKQSFGLYFFAWSLSVLLLLLESFFVVQYLTEELAAITGLELSAGSESLGSLLPSLILIPGMVLATGILVFVVSQLLALFSAVIIKSSVKKGLSFRDAWVLCLHAILVPMFLFVVLAPSGQLFWLFIVLLFFYALFVAIGTSLVAGRTLKSTASQGDGDENGNL